jgi:hypothetical protein
VSYKQRRQPLFCSLQEHAQCVVFGEDQKQETECFDEEERCGTRFVGLYIS